MDQPGKVANSACGQLNTENNIPLSPYVPGNDAESLRCFPDGFPAILYSDHERDWPLPPCKVVFFRVGNQCAECESSEGLGVL